MSIRFGPSLVRSFAGCGSAGIDWSRVCGRGTVYTFTVIRAGVPAALREYLPYAVVVVTLSCGSGWRWRSAGPNMTV
jgi:uncharacterized OB-fold protein